MDYENHSCEYLKLEKVENYETIFIKKEIEENEKGEQIQKFIVPLLDPAHNLEMKKKFQSKLILKVKLFRVLYDKSHIFHRNNIKRMQAWEKIASELGKNVKICKETWDKLRNVFRTYYNTVKRNSGDGSTTRETNVKWEHYDAMKFLKPYMGFTNRKVYEHPEKKTNNYCNGKASKKVQPEKDYVKKIDIDKKFEQLDPLFQPKDEGKPLKLGEIYTFDLPGSELYFYCCSCDAPYEIVSMNFLSHIKNELCQKLLMQSSSSSELFDGNHENKNSQSEEIKDETVSDDFVEYNTTFLSEDDMKQDDIFLNNNDHSQNSFDEFVEEENESISTKNDREAEEENKIAQKEEIIKKKKVKKPFLKLKIFSSLQLKRNSRSENTMLKQKKKKSEEQTEKDDNLICGICKKTFTDPYKVKRHGRRVHLIDFKKPKWSCIVCEFKSKTVQEACDHRTKHSEAGLELLECDKCGRKFKSDILMEGHKCSELSNYCNVCKVYYMQGADFDNHECTLAKKAEEQGLHVFVCKKCPKKFTTEIRLKIHEHLHGAVKTNGQYDCFICDKKFKLIRCLSGHLQGHSDAKFPCDNCDKVFDRRRQFYTHHVKEHLKRYQCRFCGKTHLSETEKRAHETSHTGVDKPHQCYQCGRTFALNAKLQDHMNAIHFKRYQFKCPNCPKRFNTKKMLNAHHFRHLPGRNYHCTLCSRSSKTSEDLRRHMKHVHLKDQAYKCEFCTKIFLLHRNFKEHMKQHTNKFGESST